LSFSLSSISFLPWEEVFFLVQQSDAQSMEDLKECYNLHWSPLFDGSTMASLWDSLDGLQAP
jgi:hypothetical protein